MILPSLTDQSDLNAAIAICLKYLVILNLKSLLLKVIYSAQHAMLTLQWTRIFFASRKWLPVLVY